MLRPSPNHGTQRLPNDDDDDICHKARDVLAQNFFVLQLFANTACLFHWYQADGYCRCVIL